MRTTRFVLGVFGAIFLLGALSVLEEELGVPPIASAVVAIALPIVVIARVFGDVAREDRGTAADRPLPKPATHAVRFDDAEITVLADSVVTERVAWDELLSVAITIEDHVLMTVPWWRLFGRGANASYRSDALGHEEMLRELQRRLPGFDNAAVVQAMGMTDGGVMVWERTGIAGDRQTA